MDRLNRDSAVGTLLHDFEPTLPFVTSRSRKALGLLRDAFEEGRSLAVLNSGWIAGSNQLVQEFLAEVSSQVLVVRVTSRCSLEIDAMRKLIRAIGFEPKSLTITDLRRIFENFLVFQRKRKRRTVVVLEESGKNSSWVRSYTARLVEMQEKGRYGLTVILLRQTKFNEVGGEPPLDSLSYKTGKHINLTPFTQGETREFVRWRINAAETADIGKVLDFEAITLIHELCEGIPDAIDQLCCSSLELADNENIAPATTEIVLRASKRLGLQAAAQQTGANSRTAMTLPREIPTLKPIEVAKIILTHRGKTIRELTIGEQRLSIGRSKENALCIDSPYVSRRHAVIFRNGGQTAIVDLDSKNGTFVNAHRVQVQTILDQDEITIAGYRLRFSDPDAPRLRSLNGISHSDSPPRDSTTRTRPGTTSIAMDVVRR